MMDYKLTTQLENLSRYYLSRNLEVEMELDALGEEKDVVIREGTKTHSVTEHSNARNRGDQNNLILTESKGNQ